MSMNKPTRFLLVLLLSVFASHASAQERITDADSTKTTRSGFFVNTNAPDDVYQVYLRAVSGKAFRVNPALRDEDGVFVGQKEMGINRWDGKLVNPRYGTDDSKLQWTLFSPELVYSSNSDFPLGVNDGALWQGVGTNMAVRAGAGIAIGPLTAVIRPVYVSSENSEFTLSSYPQFNGISDYGRPLSNIDYPQRFGEQSVDAFDPGDSYLQLAARGVAVGFSNERFSMGPAIHNPLLLSANAPGFYHGYLKTDAPVQTRAGELSGSWFWGTIQESDFFDEDPSNDRRYITGFSVNYRPSFLNGLDVGINRVAYGNESSGGFGFSEFMTAFRLSQPKTERIGADTFHVMTSLYGRWVFESANVELYGEWGLNNNRRRMRDLLAEPELNRGFMLGVLKTFSLSKNGRLVLNIEATNLENSSVGAQFRDESNTWYEHPAIRQGFTHEGQLLGAGIGPGSSAETGRLIYFGEWGMAGITLQRVASFYDRFYREQETYIRLYPFGEENWFMLDRFMNHWTYGADAALFLPFDTDLRVEYLHTSIHNLYNRYQRDLVNHMFRVSLRKNF